MPVMNERTVQIVRLLSHSSKAQSLGELAKALGVSQRTVRNDIAALNSFLRESNLGTVSFGHKGAIVLPEDFSKAEFLLPVEDTFVYKLFSDERKRLGAALLASSCDYMTLNRIAELFSVSRATILNDLDGIKDAIEHAGLSVVSRPSKGIAIRGSERVRRDFLIEFLSNDAPVVEQWYSIVDDGRLKEDLVTIRKILNERLHSSGIAISDQDFRTVVAHLLVSVLRDREGCQLEDGALGEKDAPVGEKDEPNGLELQRGIVSLVEQYCSVPMGKGEPAYLAERFQKLRIRDSSQFSIEDMHVQKLARSFIRELSPDLGIDLNGDYDLFEYLSNHLESMFNTDPSRFPDNLALREVVDDQPYVLPAVKRHLGPLEDYAGRKITSSEALYIALHICAALERRKARGIRPRVVVVCDGGVGTSQLLAEELRGRFDIRIVKVMPAHDIPFIKTYRANLVISTIPLRNCPVEQIVVRLPMTQNDMNAIHEKLFKIESDLRESGEIADETLSAKGLLSKLEPVIRQNAGNVEDIVKAVRVEVRRYFREVQSLEDDLVSPYLHQLLPASHIQLDVDCTDWRDAITQSAEPLVRMGYIERRYIDSMIAGVEEYGPYISLAPGFAIPHSSPEDGTIKMGMNLIRLKRPILFGREENDPIRFVITLSAVDRKLHLKAFANLLDIITKPNSSFRDEMEAAKTPEDAAAIIVRYEYQVTQ